MDNKILIVEDEFVTANALRLLLEQAGYSVTGIVSSVEEAYKNLQKERPDLVLLDIRLEGKQSGIDLAKKLKDLNIAFIYLSANSSQKVLEEAKETQPYGFLVKPYREKDVLVALEIASYHHKSSLESKLRQQEILQRQLAEICYGTQETKQKILGIGKAFQPYLPFDLIIVAPSHIDRESCDAYGYLRTGYDEYQFIGQKESMTITGLNGNAFCCENSHSDTEAHICDLNSTVTGDTIPFQKIMKGNFRIASYLAFPVKSDKGALSCYFFCSRKPDMYHQYHLDLLAGLEICFASLLFKKSANIMGSTQKAQTQNLNVTEVLPDLFEGIIGAHPLLLAALDLTVQVAPFTTSVLLLGESGTGKEKIAEAIHTLSNRKGTLVKVNCAAIPASLIESELFGYEKGAFTGADTSRKGKFEQADGGTLFLDEIGELSLSLQVRLLRVLQEKEIDPLGSNTLRKVDVRIVAATNRNLEKAVAEGSFRLDLYYRLNVFPITLPALRERKSDIMPLALHFAQRFCLESNRVFTGISTSMAEEMLCYDWPGNIRELENIMERSVILNDGKSELQLRPGLITTNTGHITVPSPETFEDVKNLQRETERNYIIAVLTKTNGRIRGNDGAAELLNIKPTTLESKMSKLGINKEDFKGQA